MRIGIDFDNTIVSYDILFHRVAVEKSLVPTDIAPSKLAVRDYLRKIGNEGAWTEMQGYVYGARMADAIAYPGALEFMRLARRHGASLAIVSHKTKFPFRGPQYDLHASARSWVNAMLANGTEQLIGSDQVFFELTKQEKLRRISDIGCDYFIDDLPEILLAPDFPTATTRVLFDPENGHSANGVSVKVTSWHEASAYFEGKWKSCR